TIALTDQVTLRGFTSFTARLPRLLSGSVGFLHSTPLGQAESQIASGTGDALQTDAGLTWGFTDTLVGQARYSLAYQFNQGGGLTDSLVHVFLVGIAVRYASSRQLGAVPSIVPQRVDAADAPGFGGVDALRDDRGHGAE